MTLPEVYTSQLEHIQESPKYRLDSDSRRVAVPFPGYSIITPPAEEDSGNQDFYQRLRASQQELADKLDSDLLIPVPPESLHLTLADLIWDDAYRHASQDPEFDGQLNQAIAQSFASFQEVQTHQPIRWQVLGMIVMTRAIGVCLVPRDEISYNELVQFRRAIYQNPSFMALGIEQQYHLTAHITFGYFGTIPSNLNRDQVSTILSEFNHQWMDSQQELLIKRTELRKFEDMTCYRREEDWPAIEF